MIQFLAALIDQTPIDTLVSPRYRFLLESSDKRVDASSADGKGNDGNNLIDGKEHIVFGGLDNVGADIDELINETKATMPMSLIDRIIGGKFKQ